MSNFIKLLSCAFSLAMIAQPLEASVSLKIGTSGWGNFTTTSQNGMIWGIVVSSTSPTFAPTTGSLLENELVGFSIPAAEATANPVQIGGSTFFFARAQSTTSGSGPPTFTNGFMNTVLFNLNAPVTPSDAVGLLWFAEGTTTIGSHFGYQNINFVVPSDGAVITSGISSTPGLATFTIGAPEPSRAAFLGFAIGGLILRRQRR